MNAVELNQPAKSEDSAEHALLSKKSTSRNKCSRSRKLNSVQSLRLERNKLNSFPLELNLTTDGMPFVPGVKLNFLRRLKGVNCPQKGECTLRTLAEIKLPLGFRFVKTK